MKTDEIRDLYLKFFEAKGHKIIASDSLIPADDPTLLFTGAGMNQFKDYFLGIKKDLTRATTSQKCIRTGDLDNVGVTPFHHSFFEMLGNFSFGDYFKEEAIRWAIELLTEKLQIPMERLYISVHYTDEEAFKIWRDKVKMPEGKIARLGDKANFWPSDAPKMGPNGPCGPCSEIYYDQRPELGVPGKLDLDDSRFAEIWNLVFTQYDRQEGAKLDPLKQKNIDTGAGLERFACVLQGCRDNYEIDIIWPMVEFVMKELTQGKMTTLRGQTTPHLQMAKAVVDHGRAAVFSIADGVLPSNEGRGYVIRKLIRRAVWKCQKIKENNNPSRDSFFYLLADKVTEKMARAYPNLKSELDHVRTVIKGEEERFMSTLDEGKEILSKIIRETSAKGRQRISAEDTFRLYDTYGFPEELTAMIAEENKLEIDRAGFENLMEEQRKRAKAASKIADSIFVGSEGEGNLAGIPGTDFTGYSALTQEAKVLLVEKKGDAMWAVLDKSPFYAEQGGQVGDQGVLTWADGKAEVLDTQWKDKKWILHKINILSGEMRAGMKVQAEVSGELRGRTMRHHTATHLLHAALRKVLGTHARQLGSLVSPEKLRFDFSHPKPLTRQEWDEIELFVNRSVLDNLAVSADEMAFNEAQEQGALAFFGDKYGAKVRVLSVAEGVSKELCGGTHVNRTGDIGAVLILSESSVGSGIRRIEAVAGKAAVEHAQKLRDDMDRLSQVLKTSKDEVVSAIQKLQEKAKSAAKNKGAGVSSDSLEDIAKSGKGLGEITLVYHEFDEMENEQLRSTMDLIRQKLDEKQHVIVLFSKTQDAGRFLVSSNHAKVDASKVAKAIAQLMEGSGGGKKDFAQGGCKKIELIGSALTTVQDIINGQLGN